MNRYYIRHEFNKETYEKYYNMETEWMAPDGYPQSKEGELRQVALRVILHSSKCDKLDAYTPYIAMNIFDRFISSHQLPNVLSNVQDNLCLTAHCSLLLAWQTTELFTFSLDEFVEKRNLVKEYVLKVYAEIMNTQAWDRRVTPICFVEFFAAELPVGRRIKRRCFHEIIIQTQADINFTTMRPSVIAASAILAAGMLKFGSISYNFNKRILLTCKYVKEEDLEACFPKIHEMCIDKNILVEENEGRESAAETSSHDMNFELKWLIGNCELPEEWTINFPRPTPKKARGKKRSRNRRRRMNRGIAFPAVGGKGKRDWTWPDLMYNKQEKVTIEEAPNCSTSLFNGSDEDSSKADEVREHAEVFSEDIAGQIEEVTNLMRMVNLNSDVETDSHVSSAGSS